MSSNSSRSKTYLFTSESVSEGHPDKIADQISDVILDAFLARDPNARVACETVLANQFVLVAGEFKTADNSVFEAVQLDAERLVRNTLREIGYTSVADGIDPDRCEIRIAFNHQSAHIEQGVDREDGEIGAGDQGLMFGHASDETPELMPLAISLAHRLVRRQAEVRKSGKLPWLRPDAKSQVSVRYIDGQPVAVEKVVLSTQHSPDISTDALRKAVLLEIIDPIIPAQLRGATYQVLINPTGRFEIGGPNGDTGLTGRKIIVDSYGGSCPHGGGAFSGKDPSKVDRSGAYMARYIAKNVVAAKLARRCTVQLAYAIGVVDPVSVLVDTHGTGIVGDEALVAAVEATFDLTPRGIIEALNLCRPIYRHTAAYGHFGRTDLDCSWERTDASEILRASLSKQEGQRDQ
jgi:S-adenosylmethionine synthetase